MNILNEETLIFNFHFGQYPNVGGEMARWTKQSGVTPAASSHRSGHTFGIVDGDALLHVSLYFRDSGGAESACFPITPVLV